MKNLISILLFFLGFGIANAQLSEGLIAHYPFNGNANDESGSQFNGTVNGADLTEDRFGNLNSAYSFNGVGDVIQIADEMPLRLANTDFTISLWVNVNDFTDPTACLLSKRSGSDNNGYMFQVLGYNHPFGFLPGQVSFIASGGFDPHVFSATGIEKNQWVHLAVCFGKSNQIANLFINGEPSGSIGINSLNSSTSANLFIGFDGGFSGNFAFKGAIDDIRFYNRQLCGEEIDDLLNEGLNNVSGTILKSNVLLSPSPVSGYLNISVTGKKPAKIKVFDVTGKVVISQPWEPRLDLSVIASGVYFLQLLDSEGDLIDTRKFIKINTNRA